MHTRDTLQLLIEGGQLILSFDQSMPLRAWTLGSFMETVFEAGHQLRKDSVL